MERETAGGFPTTDWSLLSRARRGGPADSAAPFEELLARYVPAIRRYLLRVRRIERGRAEDVIQSFVAEKLLDRALLRAADRERGRFRNLLVRALENFIVDAFRRERRRNPEEPSPAAEFTSASDAGGNPVDAFELEWARSAIQEAVERTFAYCQRRRRDDLWQVLKCRIIDPAADGVPPPSYSALVERFGYATPAEAANALLSAKRIFIRMLRDVLAEQAGGAGSADEELSDLRTIVGRRAKSSTGRRKHG